MKFVVIDPKKRTIETVDARNLVMAEQAAGLDPKAVDHGSILRRIGYVVHEFGLFVPALEQSYFSWGNSLIAGACVCYGYDEAGETIDLDKLEMPDVRFFHGGAPDVEAAIERGEIRRPQIAVNGKVSWQWPQPWPVSLL